MAGSSLGEGNPLAEAFSDLFILAIRLRSAEDYGIPETFRQRVIQMFDAADEKGEKAGIPQDVLQQARYPVAAFIDEVILSSSWSQKEQWSARPLQYEFFKDSTAGTEFFNRLEGIRRGGLSTRNLLEVYYLCLILGFEGQYKIYGTEKLKGLVDEIARDLKAQSGETLPLSPHGKIPDEFFQAVKEGLPSWVVVVSSVAILFFFYLAVSLFIHHDADTLISSVTQSVEEGQ